MLENNKKIKKGKIYKHRSFLHCVCAYQNKLLLTYKLQGNCCIKNAWVENLHNLKYWNYNVNMLG